ncbi:MAG: 3'-5' exonuclease domain-containing protein 2 [Chitinispirillaceae bacterium]|nr:3'-5' exonuclease domain-containing protein 2 [Chitinispirillaceae bacterium]
MTYRQNSPPLQTRDTIPKMAPFIGLNLTNVHLVTTPQEAASALNNLLCNPFLGFDTESRPTFRKGQKSEGPHVLQFATQHSAYLFQTYFAFCRPAVAEILESKHISKIGFGLNDDIKRIAGKFQIQSQAIIDLNHTFKRNFGQKNSVGVKTAIALLFNRRFIKSHKATTSNWSNRVLSEKQLLYAANDAFAAIAVYTALKKRGIEVV